MSTDSLGLQPYGPDSHLCHATCVAIEGRAALIVGQSGTGKSSLAVQMIALEAQLIADDQTVLRFRDNQVIAQPVPHLSGMIEARGIGLMNAPFASEATVALIVDMDHRETHRLPEQTFHTLNGVEIPLAYRVDAPHFAAALTLYLTQGRLV